MDIAQRVFPCFDQNDLKAPIDADRDRRPGVDRARPTAGPSLSGPAAGGGSRPRRRSRCRCSWSCAGPWHSVTVGARRPAVRLARPRARWPPSSTATPTSCGEVTEALLRPLRRRSSPSPTPFDSYDQAFVPGPELGRAGDTGLRDLPRRVPAGRPGHRRRPRIAARSMIAHEMAHMWFGDLVTMTLVGGHLAAGVLRRLHGLPGRGGRGRRSPAALRRLRDRPQAGRVRRRRAAVHPPGGAAWPRRSPTSTRPPTTSTRSPTPRATRRCASWSPGSATRLPGRGQRAT